MVNLTDVFDRIETVTQRDLENKSIFELLGSISEEHGELARELAIEEASYGNIYKKSDEGSKAESVDLAISALAMLFARGGDIRFFVKKAEEKLDKWERNQKPQE